MEFYFFELKIWCAWLGLWKNWMFIMQDRKCQLYSILCKILCMALLVLYKIIWPNYRSSLVLTYFSICTCNILHSSSVYKYLHWIWCQINLANLLFLYLCTYLNLKFFVFLLISLYGVTFFDFIKKKFGNSFIELTNNCFPSFGS